MSVCAAVVPGFGVEQAGRLLALDASTMLSAAIAVMAALVSTVTPAMCAVRTTFGRSVKRVSVGGSCSRTSRPAPASLPPTRAASSASSSIRRAARGVDQEGGRLHQREPVGVDEVDVLAAAGRVEGDVVAALEQVFERDQLDAPLLDRRRYRDTARRPAPSSRSRRRAGRRRARSARARRSRASCARRRGPGGRAQPPVRTSLSFSTVRRAREKIRAKAWSATPQSLAP